MSKQMGKPYTEEFASNRVAANESPGTNAQPQNKVVSPQPIEQPRGDGGGKYAERPAELPVVPVKPGTPVTPVGPGTPFAPVAPDAQPAPAPPAGWPGALPQTIAKP